MVESITLLNAALDELEVGGKKTIVLRGVVAPFSLCHLKIDDYQREALPLASINRLIKAIKEGETLPDIELGMRGQKFRSKDDTTFQLQDAVYIIDGQQRRNAALQEFQLTNNSNIRLGALIHFSTTKEWERERFRILNLCRAKVSPNILLRNERENSNAILTLYGLSNNDNSFPLRGRVSWSQSMKRGTDLITALTLCKVAITLHSRGTGGGGNLKDIVTRLDNLGENLGLSILRDNVSTFFQLLEDCWGLRAVTYKETAVHIRGAFLRVLALMLASHKTFWKGKDNTRLFIDGDQKKKLKLFALNDPGIRDMTGASGRSLALLYEILIRHMNSGRRINQLQPWPDDRPKFDFDEAEPEADAA